MDIERRLKSASTFVLEKQGKHVMTFHVMAMLGKISLQETSK